jgi:hypothetical protein
MGSQNKLFAPFVVVEGVLAGAYRTQPDDAPSMTTIQVSEWFNKQFSFAHPPEFTVAGRVKARGDARFQHGTSTQPVRLSEDHSITY